MALRFLLLRLLGALAALLRLGLAGWMLGGGLGRVLRGERSSSPPLAGSHALVEAIASWLSSAANLANLVVTSASQGGLPPIAAAVLVAIAVTRILARRRRSYVRLQVEPYRGDSATPDALVTMFEELHKRLLERWWRRLLRGQPSISVEVHYGVPVYDESTQGDTSPSAGSVVTAVNASAWFAVACPSGLTEVIEAALRAAYPNIRLRSIPLSHSVSPSGSALRLKKRTGFLRRVKSLDRYEQEREPPVNRLIRTMAAGGEPACVQIAMTPAPAFFDHIAKRLYKHHEARLSRERREHLIVHDRSLVDDVELRGGLRVQHRALFFADIRVIAGRRRACELIASELRAESAENRLVERGTAVRHGLLRMYGRRVVRGEGNPLPSFHKGVYASTELAAMWQLPSIDFVTVPVKRSSVPFAPAPPGILRVAEGRGTLRDPLGVVSIHEPLRQLNAAVVGGAKQGKTTYLVATVAEDLGREGCSVIVLDPVGDAADATVRLVPAPRACTMLDLDSPSTERALLGGSLRVDFERMFAREEVLVVRGSGTAGKHGTPTLMQMLLGMLDTALTCRRDPERGSRRASVALKIDEAPLVFGRGFARTTALMSSAGLETVACWRTDAQWADRDVREQLDALFAHRVYFATPSVRDARASVGLTMAEFSDTLRPSVGHVSALGHPDVRLHLPPHYAIASWTTVAGRQASFVAQTIPPDVHRWRGCHAGGPPIRSPR